MWFSNPSSLARCYSSTIVFYIKTKESLSTTIKRRISIVTNHPPFVFLFEKRSLRISSLPEPALDLFDRMLELDPSKRISASDALLSNWLKDINDDNIRPIQ